PAQLTDGVDSNRQPTFSPDGTKIAWANRDGGDFEIAVMNVDGTSPVRLTNNVSDDTFPDFSPDGTKIVYANSGLSPGIYVLNADGTGNPTPLTTTFEDTEPRYSPDGKKLAFIRDGTLFTMDPSGAGQVWTGMVADSFAWDPRGANAPPVVVQE